MHFYALLVHKKKILSVNDTIMFKISMWKNCLKFLFEC